MQTDNRLSLKFFSSLVLALAAFCLSLNPGISKAQSSSPLVPQVLVPQNSSNQDTNPLGAIIANPAEPSVLSEWVPEEMSDKITGKPINFGLEGGVFISKDIDLSQTLKSYAAIKNVSMNEAFKKAIGHLKLAPIQKRMEGEAFGSLGFYKVVSGDTYQITARTHYFDTLSQNLTVIENGIQQVVIEATFVYLPEERLQSVRRFMIPDSFEAFNNRFQPAKPVATHATYKKSDSPKMLQPLSPTKAVGTFVSSSETRTKVYPTFLGRFEPSKYQELMENFDADEAVEKTLAPKLMMLAGLPASFSDSASKPFVVGVTKNKEQFQYTTKPIIQSIEDGVVVKVIARRESGGIRIDGDLALSEVLSVETFGYADTKNTEEKVTLQVPEHKLKQVHWSTLIEDGNVIMLDPVVTENYKVGKKRKLLGKDMPLVQKKRMVIFVSAKLVEDPKQDK